MTILSPSTCECTYARTNMHQLGRLNAHHHVYVYYCTSSMSFQNGPFLLGARTDIPRRSRVNGQRSLFHHLVKWRLAQRRFSFAYRNFQSAWPRHWSPLSIDRWLQNQVEDSRRATSSERFVGGRRRKRTGSPPSGRSSFHIAHREHLSS